VELEFVGGHFLEAGGVGGWDLVPGLDAGGVVGEGGESDGLFGEVLGIEAAGGEDVGGVGEVVEHGEGDADGDAGAAFEHAADPAGDAGPLAEVVDFERVGESAAASGLDVDVFAGAEGDGFFGGADGVDTFVEADGCFDIALEFGVVDDIVVIEGLFDHGEVEFVDLAEEIEVGDGVAAVAIDVEDFGGELFADPGKHVGVPTGAEFEFDAGEFLRDGARDIAEEVIDGIEDAEVGTDGDGVAGGSEEFVEGLFGDDGLEIPPGHVEECLGEGVALEHGEALLQVVAGGDVLSDESGGHPAGGGGEDAVAVFGAVTGGGEGGAFGPGGGGTAGKTAEDGMDLGIFAIGGAPGIDQGHGDVIKFNSVDFHGVVPASCGFGVKCGWNDCESKSFVHRTAVQRSKGIRRRHPRGGDVRDPCVEFAVF